MRSNKGHLIYTVSTSRCAVGNGGNFTGLIKSFQLRGRKNLATKFWPALVSNKLATGNRDLDVIPTEIGTRWGTPLKHDITSRVGFSYWTTIKQESCRGLDRIGFYALAAVSFTESTFSEKVVMLPLCVQSMVDELLCKTSDTTSSSKRSEIVEDTVLLSFPFSFS